MKWYPIHTGPSENTEKNSIDLKWAKISGAPRGNSHQWGEEEQTFGSLEVKCGPNLSAPPAADLPLGVGMGSLTSIILLLLDH